MWSKSLNPAYTDNHGAKSDGKRFVFQNFAKRVATVSLDEVHRRTDLSDLREEGNTYAASTLERWVELNSTVQFKEFRTQLAPLVMTVPLILRRRQQIFEIVRAHLAVAPVIAIKPMLEVTAALAVDLRQEFYPEFPALLGCMAALLKPWDVELLEAVFGTICLLFQYLLRQLLADLPNAFLWYREMLSHPKPHVRDFAAESFAYLLRQAPLSAARTLRSAVVPPRAARSPRSTAASRTSSSTRAAARRPAAWRPSSARSSPRCRAGHAHRHWARRRGQHPGWAGRRRRRARRGGEDDRLQRVLHGPLARLRTRASSTRGLRGGRSRRRGRAAAVARPGGAARGRRGRGREEEEGRGHGMEEADEDEEEAAGRPLRRRGCGGGAARRVRHCSGNGQPRAGTACPRAPPRRRWSSWQQLTPGAARRRGCRPPRGGARAAAAAAAAAQLQARRSRSRAAAQALVHFSRHPAGARRRGRRGRRWAAASGRAAARRARPARLGMAGRQRRAAGRRVCEVLAPRALAVRALLRLAVLPSLRLPRRSLRAAALRRPRAGGGWRRGGPGPAGDGLDGDDVLARLEAGSAGAMAPRLARCSRRPSATTTRAAAAAAAAAPRRRRRRRRRQWRRAGGGDGRDRSPGRRSRRAGGQALEAEHAPHAAPPPPPRRS